MSEINIIELIEKNPITKLSPTYNSKFINKIKEHFDDFEKNLFASSFYCYLNYDKNRDFVIDLDHVWKFLDFCKKCDAKNLLEKSFKENIDYKYISKEDLLLNSQQQRKGRGGHNVKKIFLTSMCVAEMFMQWKQISASIFFFSASRSICSVNGMKYSPPTVTKEKHPEGFSLT
jgi:hypothetical protein